MGTINKSNNEDVNSDIIYTTKSDYNLLATGQGINIDGQNISIELLKRIALNPDYYNYAYRFFSGEIKEFKISNLVDGSGVIFLSYSKTQIIKGLDYLYMMGVLGYSPELTQKIQNLKSYITINKFNEAYGNAKYAISVDGADYLIPIDQMLLLLQMDSSKFKEFCQSDTINKVTNIPKNHFLYAILRFFSEYKILGDYALSPVIEKNFNDLSSYELIDIQALNEHNGPKPSLVEKTSINKSLFDAIVGEMPNDLSQLEKSIYIYIKMCKTLTYDEEYYAVSQKGEATQKHLDANHISEITPDNNAVVCYEFNLIYAKFLASLGISFTMDYFSDKGEMAYGSGHARLGYRTGKYLVNADSVVRILASDMSLAKMNEPLMGLKCLNKNKITQNEFQTAVANVYTLINEQERAKGKADSADLEQLVSEYSKATNRYTPISFKEKLSTLTIKVNAIPTKGNVDLLSYVLLIMKNAFNKKELSDNIHITIVRDNYPENSELAASPTIIFSVNELGFNEYPECTTYFSFTPTKRMTKISKEELQERFDNLAYEYIDDNGPKIEGIFEFAEARS